MRHIDEGHGTPILWIHGFPLSSAVFAGQLEIQDVRHLVPELPGFGGEPPSEVTSLDDYADRCIALLDEKGIDKAIVAGVSMGGYISLTLARLHPHRLLGIILIDSRETPDTDEARRGRYASIETVKREGTKPVVEAMLPKMLTDKAAPELVARVRSIMESASVDGTVAALGAMAARPDATDVLRAFDGPVMIVVGEEDTITPPADAERMASIARNGSLTRIANAAHLSMMEQPAIFNAAVGSWLGRSKW